MKKVKHVLLLTMLMALMALPMSAADAWRHPVPAHAEIPAPVIVSLNIQPDSPAAPVPAQPQVFAAVFDGPPQLTAPIYVRWPSPGGGQYGISIGASTKFPLHLGVLTGIDSGNPGTEEHDLFASLGNGVVAEGGLGEINVRDLAADPDGTITRFDITFKVDEATPAGNVFGQLRYGVEESGPVSATAESLSWPTVNRFATPVVASDAFRNVSSTPVRLGRLVVADGDRADFRLRSDTCSGATLEPGAQCEVVIAFAPTGPGPRVSSLIVPFGRSTLAVDLTGRAPLGVTSLVVSGNDVINLGRRHTFPDLLAFGTRYPAQGDGPLTYTYRFVADPWPAVTPGYRGPVRLDLTGLTAPLPTGRHVTDGNPRGFGLRYEADYRFCSSWSGTENVRALAVDQDNQPTFAAVDFTLNCRSWQGDGVMTGRLNFRVRRDVVAPEAPSALRVRAGVASWTPSILKGVRTTIVRITPGSKVTPTSGLPVSVGMARSASLPRLVKGRTYTIAAFSIDRSGNVSRPRTLTFVAR